jgi:hypothetical protein
MNVYGVGAHRCIVTSFFHQARYGVRVELLLKGGRDGRMPEASEKKYRGRAAFSSCFPVLAVVLPPHVHTVTRGLLLRYFGAFVAIRPAG